MPLDRLTPGKAMAGNGRLMSWAAAGTAVASTTPAANKPCLCIIPQKAGTLTAKPCASGHAWQDALMVDCRQLGFQCQPQGLDLLTGRPAGLGIILGGCNGGLDIRVRF